MRINSRQKARASEEAPRPAVEATGGVDGHERSEVLKGLIYKAFKVSPVSMFMGILTGPRACMNSNPFDTMSQ